MPCPSFYSVASHCHMHSMLKLMMAVGIELTRHGGPTWEQVDGVRIHALIRQAAVCLPGRMPQLHPVVARLHMDPDTLVLVAATSLIRWIMSRPSCAAVLHQPQW
jgi:hypothetical protein